MTTVPVSLVVITRNEEANIERCLASAPFVAEKVVLDSFSTDRTCEIAKAMGAKVIQEKFAGFGAQKRRVTELASRKWVLSLDGDEALSPELQQKIIEMFRNGEPNDAAFRIARLSFHMGRWIRHGGWFPDWQIRLFDRERAAWNTAELHEKVEVDGRIETLKSPIFHWVFSSLSNQIETNNRYSSLGAQQLFDNGQRFHWPLLVIKPVSKFFETYFWKRGFMDGLPGFVIAVGASYSVFLKFAKLWELEQKPVLRRK